jgi:restriction endonuclease S subunit
VKIENDGFDLGAQRRAIPKNDLPQALRIIEGYRRKTTAESAEDAEKNSVSSVSSAVEFLIVPKAKIAENGEYSLTGERYKAAPSRANRKWEMVKLGDVLDYEQPTDYIVESIDYNDNYKTPVLTAGQTFILGYTNETKGIFKNLPVIIFDDFTTAIKFVDFPFKVKSSAMKILKNKDNSKSDIQYLYRTMQTIQFNSQTHKRYWISEFSNITIPLPPLSAQQAIVAAIESYQKVIDGARQVADNWKPRIEIDESWEMVKLGDVCMLNPKKLEVSLLPQDTLVSFLPMEDIGMVQDIFPKREKLLSEVYKGYSYFQDNDILVAKVTPCFENGKGGIVRNLKNGIGFGSTELHIIRPSDKVLPEYIYPYISSTEFLTNGKDKMTGTGGLQRLPIHFVADFKIPLPPLSVQQAIVAEIEQERKIVDGNKRLIALYESKIKRVINKVWEE